MNEIFVDFNSIGLYSAGKQKRVHSLRKFAANPEIINVGDRLLANDGAGTSCYAIVTEIWDDGVIELELDI